MDKQIDKQNNIEEFSNKLKRVYGLTIFETTATALASFVLVKDIGSVFGSLSIVLIPGVLTLVSAHGSNKINNIQNEIENLEKNKTKVKCINYK